jgi:hypothetical protein
MLRAGTDHPEILWAYMKYKPRLLDGYPSVHARVPFGADGAGKSTRGGYFLPVWPNPPAPRPDSVKSSTN